MVPRSMKILCGVAWMLLATNVAYAAAINDTQAPQIVHEPCEEYEPGRDFIIWARFYDDSPIFDPKVIYRSGGPDWRSTPFAKVAGGSDFRAVIPAKALSGPIDYLVEAFDENGNGPARFGSPEAPVRVFPQKNAPQCKQIEDEPASALGSVAPNKRAEPLPAQAQAPSPLVPAPISAVTQPPPPPPAEGCAQEDAPFYCSGVFWGVVGLTLAGGAAGCYLTPQCQGLFVSTASGPATVVDLVISAPNPAEQALR